MIPAARIAHHRRAAHLAPAVVIVAAMLAARLPVAQSHPALSLWLCLWLAADSLLLSRIVRDGAGRPDARTVCATLAGACCLVSIAAPPALRAALLAMPGTMVAMALALLAHLALAGRQALAIMRRGSTAARWESVAAQFLPPALVRLARAELVVLHMALLRWGGPADVPPGARAFAYHRHLTPMAITLLSLSAIEVAVYHVFLGHWSRLAALAMFVVSDLGLVYLVGVVKSFRFRPILLEADSLRIRAGLLLDVAVPLNRIESVSMAIDGAEVRDAATLNAALLAWPNVIVHLRAPIDHHRLLRRRSIGRVAFRLDEPEPFVRLLQWRLGQP